MQKVPFSNEFARIFRDLDGGSKPPPYNIFVRCPIPSLLYHQETQAVFVGYAGLYFGGGYYIMKLYSYVKRQVEFVFW